MKIQIGQVYMDSIGATLYPNKTRKYLLPLLHVYGKEFIDKFNKTYKVAAGIGDILVEKRGWVHEKHIFILLDANKVSKFFIEFLDWIKEQPMYQDDYIYGNVNKSTYHMVIVKIPEQFHKDFLDFKEGKYSQMIEDRKNMKSFFDKYPDAWKVITKDHNYKIEFVKHLNLKFDTNISSHEYDGELDEPPTAKTDIFNHHLT